MRSPSVASAPSTVRAEWTRGTAEHTPRDARHTHAGHVVEMVGSALEDRLGGPQAAADRRPDPLAQVAAGEPGRIAGDEGVVAAHDVDSPAQEVAVAGRIVV